MKKKEYNAPEMEVVDARVEQGFAGSGDPKGTQSLEDAPQNQNYLFT